MMNDMKTDQFDLNALVADVVNNSAPKSCEEIAELLAGLPPKSWVHRQLPTPEQKQAFALLQEKSQAPTLEEIRFIAEICCGKYHRIRSDGWSWPQWEKAKELYGQYYELTGSEEVKYILDNFEKFSQLCYATVSRRQRKDNFASVHDGKISTSRDPDSSEWKQ